METSSIILLVVSVSISFGLGRFIVHLRNKKRQSDKKQADKRAGKQAVQARRNLPPDQESKNKAKRKRQLCDVQRDAQRDERHSAPE